MELCVTTIIIVRICILLQFVGLCERYSVVAMTRIWVPHVQIYCLWSNCNRSDWSKMEMEGVGVWERKRRYYISLGVWAWPAKEHNNRLRFIDQRQFWSVSCDYIGIRDFQNSQDTLKVSSKSVFWYTLTNP